MSGTSDKQQRKAIAEWIDKLQARDTEKQAFVALASAIPHLAANSVPKVLLDLERKHPDPILMSTRENVVLLLELMCTTQAPACAKLRNRITAYLNRRLRDKRSKVTDACVGAAGALALHALPFLPPSELETIVQPFWTEVHIMNDGAARCLGAIFYPSSGDAALVAAHAERAMGYLISFLPQLMAKLHGKIYATYSPIFHILLRIVVLVQDVPACVELATALADTIPSLVAAVDDVLHLGQRDDWLNRKRGLDLLGALVACFPSHNAIVGLQAKLMQLAERGRSDYASPVRESASALLTHLGPLLRSSQPGHSSTDAAYAALHPVRPSSPSPPSPTRWVSSSPTKPTSFKKSLSTAVPFSPPAEAPRPVVARDDNQTSQEFADNARLAMEEGNMELALRIALLSEDQSLLWKVLAFAQPSVALLRKTTLDALCMSFVDFLAAPEKADVIFPWISCLVKLDGYVHLVDSRVLRELKTQLAHFSAPSAKESLIAARLYEELLPSPLDDE